MPKAFRERRATPAATHSSLAVLDAAGRVLGLHQMLGGYSGEEMNGHPAADLLHPDDRRAFRALLKRVRLEPGLVEHMRVRLRHRDGTVRASEIAILAPPAERPVSRLLVVGHDVTDRVAVEDELRESDARFRELAENVDQVFFLLELRDGRPERVLYVSPAVERLWGVSGEALKADPGLWLDLVAEEDRERLLVPMRRSDDVPHDRSVEYTANTRGRGPRQFVTRMFPVPGTDGESYRMAGVADDVTEARRAQRHLEENEALFRLLVEQAGDVFALVAADGIIRYESRSVQELLGYTPEQTIGTLMYDYMDPEDAPVARALLDEAFGGARRQGMIELRMRHRDGSWRRVEFFFRLHDGQAPAERLLIVNGRDVTERRRMEEELRQSQRMEAVGRLAGGVAHDFNNLLTAILGYSQLVLDELPPGGALAGDVMEIRRAAERARGVTRQLLAISRRQVLQPRVIDAAGLVRDMERMLRLLLREDVHLEVRLVDGPSRVCADPVQLQQVLLNFVVNARDATPAGGSIRIEVDCCEVVPARSVVPAYVAAGSYVRLVVADNGCGITPDVAGHVFDPFFTTKPVGQGTGLGLSTVYGIVKQSGGYVWLESLPGQGSTFSVLLPAVTEPETGEAEAPARPHVRLEGATIAVVEDEEAVRSFIAAVLRKHGMMVLSFAAPGEALAVLEAPAVMVDVLITDVVLPGMSGPALAERIRLVRPNLPVVYISGYSEQLEDFSDRLRSQVVLEKPFVADDLLQRLVDAFAE